MDGNIFGGFQWAQLLWQVLYGLITASVTVLGILLPFFIKNRKKVEEITEEKIGVAVEKLRMELYAMMAKEDFKALTQFQEGDKEFALLKQKLEHMVTESVCLQHQNKINQSMSQMNSSIEALERRLDGLAHELVKNGNLEVGKKIDQLINMIDKSIRESK